MALPNHSSETSLNSSVKTMFGLRNFRGSCWVNSALQAIFRIPEVQKRYDSEEFDKDNPIDKCLCRIWNSKGEDGLREFFQAVKTTVMPAGEDIGDAHELMMYLCDKLPYLDNICRFKIADSITCKNCKKKEIKEDSVCEFTLASDGTHTPIAECISKMVKEYSIDDWVCDDCKKTGCEKQTLIGSFPKAMIFHMVSGNDSSIDYSSILVLNKQQYAMLSVTCFDGSHWWGYGRDMPPGTSWYSLNDTHVRDHGPRQFPMSPKMRLLIYYRLDE